MPNNRIRECFLAALLSVAAIAGAPAAKAVVPYVYVPSSEELKGSAIGIGRTAAQLLQMGQPQEAAKLAALAVRLDPQDERLWSVLAEAQLRSDDLEQAGQSLARAKELNPDKAGLWFAQGALALRDEQPEEAIPLIQRGLELDPKNPAGYFDLGNAWIMLDDLSNALGSFEQATGLKPDFWEALNNQALVLYEMGNTDEAIQRWRAVLRIEENAEPLLGLASCININDTKLAIQLAKKALAKDPKYVNYDYRKEQLWGEKLQSSTEILLQNEQLRKDVILAKSKIPESS